MALSPSCRAALDAAELALLGFPILAAKILEAGVAFEADEVAVGLGLLGAAYFEATKISQQAANAINNAILCIRSFFLGGTNVACATTHKVSTVAQGPGVCCAAFTASGLTPAVGVRVVATNKLGKCIVCEVKASTSKKSPGTLVFKRGKASVPGSTISCPSTAEGCCALLGQ